MGLDSERDLIRRLGVLSPARGVATMAGFARWGPSLAAIYGGHALRTPRRPAVIDHRGVLTFRQLDRRSTELARGLRAMGARPGGDLGLLCANHRDFVEANLAAAKAGLNVVYLNTGFAGPQLAEVMAREGVVAVVHDAAFSAAADATGFDGPRIVADAGADGVGAAAAALGAVTMHAARRRGRRHPVLLVPRPTSPVLLTSGTTGLPKGARRGSVALDPRGSTGLVRRIPYRHDDVFVVPSPLFHAWGLSQLLLAAVLGAPVIVNPTFDPEWIVRSVVEHRATVLAAVPIMLQRLLGAEVDLEAMRSLRIVAVSGSALAAPVAEAWMDRVGDTLYNLYGSTEVGQATIADPQDLREAPGTAGRIAPGSDVVILDEGGDEVSDGVEGRIFVGNRAQFSGYTGGGTKEIVDGRMSTGDRGYFDADGRLFVTGRSDDMIISGGENLFPGEVEDLLLAHPDVADAAVVGVPDAEFGQRLAAFVVAVPGATVNEGAVRDCVASELARHKVPRDVTFLDEIPRTTTGKVLRRHLVAGAPAG